ncbi:hypothetical protein SUGI_0718200 [Cryptomeria japonica]|nr:hypothetical protein SUGI_0718200 [Cryptomeria japonica]
MAMGINESSEKDDIVKGYCDIFVGSWVYDESYDLYSGNQCPYSSPVFDCQKNGRKDSEYKKWRWQPLDCDIPRFNASDLLNRLRGKRLVYVGDSISHSQWESMVCLLTQSDGHGKGQSSVTTFHQGGTSGYLLKEYNCSIELSWSPFLVRQHNAPDKETLQIDTIDDPASVWKTADILVFSTGHWWTHPLPLAGKDYYEEGGFVHPHMEESVAFEKALRTWARWVDTNIDPLHTQVFFRTYSPVHFNGKMWGKKEGGGCFKETEPIAKLEEEQVKINPDMKRVLTMGNVTQEMKSKVKVVNITWMSMHRKDAHSSVYNKRDENRTESDYSKADCSHWCLPGLPDVWNHLLSVLII